MTKLELAKLFHKTYEDLAPLYGYKTRKNTRRFVEDSPNGQLMINVCSNILQQLKKECVCPNYKHGNGCIYRLDGKCMKPEL